MSARQALFLKVTGGWESELLPNHTCSQIRESGALARQKTCWIANAPRSLRQVAHSQRGAPIRQERCRFGAPRALAHWPVGARWRTGLIRTIAIPKSQRNLGKTPTTPFAGRPAVTKEYC
jgi:hypothetical protein